MQKKLSIVLVLLLAVSPALQADKAPQPLAQISTYSPAQLASMEWARRNGSSTGGYYLSAEIVQRGLEMQENLEARGPGALADKLLAVYAGDDASRDFAAAAFALHNSTGYVLKLRTGDRGLDRKFGRKAKPDPEKLVELTLPIVDALAKAKSPYGESAAVELLLQVLSECLPSGHLYADNGRRKTPTMPPQLAKRAADFLESQDPFVRGMADWAIQIKVGIDNDRNGEAWPGENPPAWFKKWMAVPASEHLALDYIRQAITLGMHRRAGDLATLSKDVMRRAREKARWVRKEYGSENPALAKMEAAHKQLMAALTGNDLRAQRKAWLVWRKTVRPVVLGGADIDFDSLVYLKRFSGGHHIQPTIHNANKFPPGGDIFIQKGLEPDAPTRSLINDQLPTGYVQDLDLWFDADKIVFSRMDGPGRNNNQQIYKINLDGSNLEQLVQSSYQDVDPAWLPDGSVVFGSTRAEAGIMCLNAGAKHTNIYRLLPDGRTIWRLSYCKDDDAYPAVLNDGRVVYMRWDYQERGVDEIFSLWSARPDGSGTDGFYRVHIPDKQIIQALKDARPIPHSQKLVAAGSSHRAGDEGMVVLCDPTMGINNPLGIRGVTPYTSPIGRGSGELMRPVDEGGVPYIGGYYAKPFALTEKTFLVAAGYDMPISCDFQACYIDVWGNKELLHRDKLMEAMSIMPVRPRFKPPVIADLRDPSKTYATCYVENVYNDLPGIEKGQVKWIRILEQMFWLDGCEYTGTFRRPGGTGQGAVRVIGIVPVLEDGSASFEVPSDAPLYFQALDENYRGLQRMRTHVEFAPGEVRGCIGCHETRGEGVTVRPKGLALAGKPVRPIEPHWGATSFINYEEMIQPVFEAKCVKCHNEKEPKGKLNLTSKKGPRGYMESYRSLWGLEPGQKWPKSRYRGTPDNPRWKAMHDKVVFILHETNGEITQPLQFGAPLSPLGKKLAEDPKHRKLLTDDEMRLLMAWLDVRAPYFSHYTSRGRGKPRVMLEPFEPFGKDREHKIVPIEE
jgi:hypothetical protein